LNGKRNGKGKEYYDNGELEFIGEYLNGKRNGKGKEYYDNGELKFEGEYLEGKRNGLGKKYFFNNDIYDDDYYPFQDLKLMFEGEFLNGIMWNGTIFDNDNNNFTEIKNGKGNIKLFNQDGLLIFEGEYSNGKRNGKGKDIMIIQN